MCRDHPGSVRPVMALSSEAREAMKMYNLGYPPECAVISTEHGGSLEAYIASRENESPKKYIRVILCADHAAELYANYGWTLKMEN